MMKRFFSLLAAAVFAIVSVGCGNDNDTMNGVNGVEGVETDDGDLDVDTGITNGVTETPAGTTPGTTPPAADATPEVDEEPATTLPDAK